METRNITSKILLFIFVGLLGYSLFVFAGKYLKFGAKKGFIAVSGRIEGREYNVGTKIAGRVDEIYIKEGMNVEAGERLAVIYTKQTSAMLESARAGLAKSRADLDLARIEFERYERLFKANAVAKMEYDRVENRYIRAKEEVVGAEKDVDRLTADLEDATIVAPISGTVVTKIVRKGEVVGAGTPIATIINMDDLYLKVFLATESAGNIKLGDEAKIYPDAMPKNGFDAYVEYIGQKAEFTPKNVETKSQRAKLVFEIRLNVKNNDSRILKPGMPCEALIKTDKNAAWK